MGTDVQPKRLFNRNFVLIWQGQMVSQFGFQISAIALSLWIKDQFDSPSLMCAVLMVFSLSFTLLTPIGGVLADKYSRKNILVISDLVTGVVALLVAGVMTSPLKKLAFYHWVYLFSTMYFWYGQRSVLSCRHSCHSKHRS